MSHSPTHDSGRPAYKRQRVGLACTSCRRRKTRCDGVRPVCAPCTQLGLTCSYEQPPQNVNDPLSMYESRLGAVEDMLRQLVDPQRSTQDHSSRPQTVSRPRSPVDQSGFYHANTAVPRAMLVDLREQQLGTPLELTIDVLASTGGNSVAPAYFFGPSSNVTFIRTVSTALDVVSNWKWRGPQPNIRDGEPLISRTPSPGPPIRGLSTDTPVDPLVLPHDRLTSRLLDEFFTTTGLLFPFVDETHLRQRFAEARSAGYSGMRISFLCLLNAIFATAARVDDVPPEDDAIEQAGSRSEI
ncbi:hypothetical protein M409DRAFT_26227 [Zasmidium cellare ATCC 36951]|uniref:Zn(2)-C6 fungal-type domain-containing protein n=1 Tax=Zasmidium cellare ATCC 36951 TaxID=1080233 RepID=A0A6A6CBM9_ZASCE|nr:uncharacterized protein M409DRAFT_26227 [Zasmidium cellare ATCC 36951]KAF2163620.1 hypothetical protein M409DRAFT_26227 [Zasmidium cellare ATCC 36951]